MTADKKITREVYVAMVGQNVRKLQKRNCSIVYKNPVAEKRAKTMRQQFLYHPIVVDAYTLKSDPNWRK